MKLLILMSSMLFMAITTVPNNSIDIPETHSETSYLNMDECHLFHSIFGILEDEILSIDDITVLELEDILDFEESCQASIEKLSYLDMSEIYLFNSIFGTIDDIVLKVEDISVLEIEETLELDFDINQKLGNCITKLSNL